MDSALPPTHVALLGYAAWFILMTLLLGGYRTGLVSAGKKQSNAFDPTGADVEGFGRRITRVHANLYENIGLAGAVLLFAIATGQTTLTDPLAPAFLGARIAQSVVHLVSTSRPMVFVRFVLFLVQISILGWWIARLAGVL